MSSQERMLDLETAQNAELDMMSASLSRLQNIGDDIKTELEVQKPDLDGLEADLDEGNDKMKTTLKKIEKVLKKNSCKGGIIGVLSATALVLVVALIAK